MRSARNRTKTPKSSENTVPDRRLAKTRSSLAKALLALMQRKDWDDFSVQEICDTADVARSSFYAHFDDKTALLDYSIAASLLQSRDDRHQHSGAIALLGWIIDHVTSNRALFYRVARSSGAQIVLTRFKAALKTELAEELRKENATVPASLADFLLGGTFDALIAWSVGWKSAQLPAVRAEILAFARLAASDQSRQ